MCSMNHSNWVTFEDEGTSLSTPQKHLQASTPNTVSVPRPNGLKLVLPPLGDQSWSFSSPLESPQMPFSFNGSFCVPSNTPMCTPVRETPSSPSPFHCGPVGQPDFFRSFSNTSTSVSSPGPEKATQPLSSEGCSPFPAFQDDPGHFNPFWGESGRNADSESSSSDSESGSSLPRFFIRTKEGFEPPRDHLQSSYSYICHKLERLRAEGHEEEGGRGVEDRESGDPGLRGVKDEEVRDGPSVFVPKGLFLSQRRHGWPLMLRIPEKKNRMSSRQWGPIYLQLLRGGVLQMYYEKGLEKPFKEFQLHSQCRLSGPKQESYGEPRKIDTLKVELVSYVERKRYHPKPEVTHEAEVEQLLKFGTTEHGDMMDLSASVEEELMRLPPPHQQRKHYEEQELSLQITDHIWIQLDKNGKLLDQAAITRVHCLAFLNGTGECFLALNDLGLLRKDSKYGSEENDEVWMEIADCYFHKCVREAEFQDSRLIKFAPPDACRFELMRFKTVSLGCSDLPFTVKAVVTVQGAYVELQAFLSMSSSFPCPAGTSETQPLCENVLIMVPVPGDWVKVPRAVSLLRQKSLKARMNRNACLGSVNVTDSHPVMQVTTGTVKYENVHGAIVWRMDRLPAKNMAVDHPHSFSCKLELASDQEIPTDWYPFVTMEFEVADVVASQTRVKSLGTESDIQPQKHVISRAFYHCQVEIEKKWIETETQKLSRCATQ
ncbi:stonin-1 [Chanos chanos]|uniref:Stonin-1 n=1 Tax=Chanos chanos TaxID=29144 RepID=A0A6J2V7J7_CHACN|nr:stonin-1 [Chanos chanos]